MIGFGWGVLSLAVCCLWPFTALLCCWVLYTSANAALVVFLFNIWTADVKFSAIVSHLFLESCTSMLEHKSKDGKRSCAGWNMFGLFLVELLSFTFVYSAVGKLIASNRWASWEETKCGGWWALYLCKSMSWVFYSSAPDPNRQEPELLMWHFPLLGADRVPAKPSLTGSFSSLSQPMSSLVLARFMAAQSALLLLLSEWWLQLSGVKQSLSFFWRLDMKY